MLLLLLLLLLFKSDVIIVTSFIRGTFLIRTPPSVPSESVLERFDCTGQNIPRAFSLNWLPGIFNSYVISSSQCPYHRLYYCYKFLFLVYYGVK